MSSKMDTPKIVPATKYDMGILLQFIQALARYEKLEHEVVATEENLKESLFGAHPAAEVLFLEVTGRKVGFALFFTSYSTFLGKPGIYLEDLFIQPEERGKGYGKALLSYLAKMTVDRNCGRLEWSVLDWNATALQFYKSVGAVPMQEWTVQRLTGSALIHLARNLKN
jgi:GNAT superfamily N-acetyltransferase